VAHLLGGDPQLAEARLEAVHQLPAVFAEVVALLRPLDLLAPAPDVLAHPRGEGVDVDGLEDEAVAAGGQRPLPVAGQRVHGDGHDGDGVEAFEGLELGGGLVAVHAREVDVE